jgi:transcriptional regulator with XRE-family HTH domain
MKCPTCGKNTLPDAKSFGLKMRKRRKGISLRSVARQMDISAAHLSDMENGKRRFTPEQTSAFIEALRQLSKKTRK